MQALKRYLLKHFEQVFVLLTLGIVVVIAYYIPYKLAFLNVFYIPIALAAYYLSTRLAMLGAVLSIILVCVYAYLYSERFYSAAVPIDLGAQILTWSSFLMLSGFVIGYLDDQLRKSRHQIAVQKHKVEEVLCLTMGAPVVRLMLESRLRTEKRRISILFCDLVGFTQYSEKRQPEVIVSSLNKYFAEIEDTLLTYQAHIDKYMGDGMMALFGAPINYEQHALLATMAGYKTQQRLMQQDFPWQMRIGVTTGEPIIGLIGHKRQSYTALGDTVNLASRIEQIATPGTVTIDETTYEVIKDYFECRRRLVLPTDNIQDPEIARHLIGLIEQIDAHPNDTALLKKIGTLFLHIKDIENAFNYFSQALELDPADSELKMTYAEVALKHKQTQGHLIRGKTKRINLYEIVALKDPLLDTNRIPTALYRQYHEQVNRLVIYPEDILLPIESLEGFVGYSKVVGFLSYAMADVLNLSGKEKIDILQAGYLANIGKGVIPSYILNYRGGLSKKDAELVREHPQEGVRKLKRLGYDSPSIFKIIESHHEHFTGGGYPADIAGEKIPIGARIVGLAEAYVSLTSRRPYREKWEPGAALAELEKGALQGKYDPRALAALNKLIIHDWPYHTDNLLTKNLSALNTAQKNFTTPEAFISKLFSRQ